MSLQNRLIKTQQKIEAITNKMKEMESSKIPTKEYAEIQAHLQRAESEFDKLLAKQEEMQASGRASGKAWDSLQYKMEEIGNAIRADKVDMQNLVAEGKAFTSGTGTENYKQLSNDLQNAKNEADQLNKKIQELISKENKAARSSKKMGNSMSNAAKKGNKAFGALARTMKMMILSMAVFNIMFKGLEFLKEGLQNLAVYSKDYNKSMSELMSSTSQLKNAIAVAFQPILNVVIPILAKLIGYLSAACNAISHFFAALGGKSTYTKAIKQNKDYAASLDKVGGASDKAQSSLAGFDDLNVLQDNAKSGGGSSDGADGSGFEEVAIDSKMASLADKVKEIIAPFKESLMAWWGNIDFQPLIDSLNNVKTAAEPLITTVLDGLLWLLNNVLEPLGSWVIEDALPVFFNALATVLNVLNGILTTLQPIFTWAWENFFEPIASWTGGMVCTIISEIANLLQRLWFEVLQPFIEWFQANILPVIQPIIDGLVGAVIAFFDMISGMVDALFQILNGVITFLSGVFTGDWDKAFKGLKEIVIGIFNFIMSFVLGIMNAVYSRISGILQTIKIIWDRLWGSMKTTVISIFNSIWNGIKGIINRIIGGIEKMANGVINGINGMINALNNLHFDIPDWVPGLGGKSFGINIGTIGTISIPRLANGGITTGSTLANIGEAGREAVLPLENNTEWMNVLVDKINANRDVNIRFEGSLAELGRILKPVIDAESVRLGTSLVLG